MAKKIMIESNRIISILNDSKSFSIRELSKKYSLNKNVIIRLLKNGKDENNNIDTFKQYLSTLRLKFDEKPIINGIWKFHFRKTDIHIFYHDNKIIVNNKKIKPIFLSKLISRYDSSLLFYSDEWTFSKDIVKSKIESSLQINNKIKIFARKCIIKEITNSSIKNSFLEKNHIQGGCNSIINYGAYYNDELVALMCFSNNRSLTNDKIKYDYELVRFSTKIDKHVVGIGSKLLSHFSKKINKKISLLSFGDKRFVLNRHNNFYSKLGFKVISQSKHDYFYYDDKKSTRIHKFTIQIKEKQNENIKNNIYKKLWDCGKYKFTKEI